MLNAVLEWFNLVSYNACFSYVTTIPWSNKTSDKCRFLCLFAMQLSQNLVSSLSAHSDALIDHLNQQIRVIQDVNKKL